VRPQLKSSLHLLRHLGALDIVPQVASDSHSPLFDGSFVVLVPSAKFELKNIGELEIVQGGCLSEHIRYFIAGNLYIQEVNSKEFPFGDYQLFGTWNYKIDATVFIVWLKSLMVRYCLANNEPMDYLCYLEFRAWKKVAVSQKAEKEAISMFFFIRFGEIIRVDVPLRHQVSIATQQSFDIPVPGERLKCDQ
jgi:hypothetical protein